MARARRLGEELADQLYASGADVILEEIRANPLHKCVTVSTPSVPVNSNSSPSQDSTDSTATTTKDEEVTTTNTNGVLADR